MGLDMHAYRMEFTPTKEVDFTDEIYGKDVNGVIDYEIINVELQEIAYWRKHPDLHGWMQKLYRKRGGENEDFNLSPLRLDAADIDALEKAVAKNRLPHTQGFFFGESQPECQPTSLSQAYFTTAGTDGPGGAPGDFASSVFKAASRTAVIDALFCGTSISVENLVSVAV